MDATPRWFTANPPEHSQRYADRFRSMAADGADLEGEARFIDAMATRGARILDAGCGPGRHAGALHRWGHDVTAVDVDPVLLDAARADHPGPRYVLADLSSLAGEQLAHGGVATEPFDLVLCAGNVMIFLAPGTERAALTSLVGLAAPGARLVFGFRRDDAYPFERFEDDAASVGLIEEHRFAGWHLQPSSPADEYRVSVLRAPAEKVDA